MQSLILEIGRLRHGFRNGVHKGFHEGRARAQNLRIERGLLHEEDGWADIMLRLSDFDGGKHERVVGLGVLRIRIKVINGAPFHEHSGGIQLGDTSVVETPVELVVTNGIGKQFIGGATDLGGKLLIREIVKHSTSSAGHEKGIKASSIVFVDGSGLLHAARILIVGFPLCRNTPCKEHVVIDLVQKNRDKVILVVGNISIITIIPRCVGIDSDKDVILAVTFSVSVEISSTNCFCCSHWQDGLECVSHTNKVGSTSLCEIFGDTDFFESNLHEYELRRLPRLFANGYDFSDDSLDINTGRCVVDMAFKLGVGAFSFELV